MRKVTDTNRLWYDQPAADWNEALPIGNGRLGAMIFGEILHEQIQLNEDSVWSGGFVDRNNPDCLENLPKVRELIFDGKVGEAEKLMRCAMTGMPESMRTYETLCDMHIDFDYPAGDCAPTDYTRALDLSTAMSTIGYTLGAVAFSRELFCSAPEDGVIAMRFKSTQKGMLSFHVTLSRGTYYDKVWHDGGNTIAINGRTGGDGIGFCAMARACATGGSVKTIGEYLIIEGADEAVIYFTAATSFREPDYEGHCADTLNAAQNKGCDALLRDQLADYKRLYDRVSLEIGEDGDAELSDLPTNKRLDRLRETGRDNALICLYYNFGRYLMIASSRPGSLPANLQGIWNKDFLAPWGSKFTVNINLQMNYWPVESSNLSECHEPYFDLLKRMVEHGRETARIMYGCRGFLCHHNTNIWGDTAPQDLWMPATYWVLNGAWLCLDIFEHYAYSHDLEFLRGLYPVMKEAALFFVDYLIEDKTGHLIVCPSTSPENTYLTADGTPAYVAAGCSIDDAILYELFSNCIETTGLLGIDAEFAETLEAYKEKLYKPQIGRRGQIMEWHEDYEEFEPGHRHISHLFWLHPSSYISPRKTPELANAARRTLELRLSHGGGHTGWSRAWIMNMWARLLDTEKTYENLVHLIAHSTLPNLFDNHPPFQIDGNFGGIAGITEMLIQSRDGELLVLPVLPKAWPKGRVSGLCIRGAGEVSIAWSDGKLESFTVHPKQDFSALVVYGKTEVFAEFKAGVDCRFNSSLERV